MIQEAELCSKYTLEEQPAGGIWAGSPRTETQYSRSTDSVYSTVVELLKALLAVVQEENVAVISLDVVFVGVAEVVELLVTATSTCTGGSISNANSNCFSSIISCIVSSCESSSMDNYGSNTTSNLLHNCHYQYLLVALAVAVTNSIISNSGN